HWLHPRPTLFPYTTLFRSRKPATQSRWSLGVIASACWSPSPLEFDSGGVRIRGQANSPLLELARVLLRFNHVASIVVNANDSVRSEEHTSELQSRVDLVCR